MKKLLKSFMALAFTASVLSSCCCDYQMCEPCCPPPECPEEKPKGCPQPHVWGDECCDPSNYPLY